MSPRSMATNGDGNVSANVKNKTTGLVRSPLTARNSTAVAPPATRVESPRLMTARQLSRSPQLNAKSQTARAAAAQMSHSMHAGQPWRNKTKAPTPRSATAHPNPTGAVRSPLSPQIIKIASPPQMGRFRSPSANARPTVNVAFGSRVPPPLTTTTKATAPTTPTRSPTKTPTAAPEVKRESRHVRSGSEDTPKVWSTNWHNHLSDNKTRHTSTVRPARQYINDAITNLTLRSALSPRPPLRRAGDQQTSPPVEKKTESNIPKNTVLLSPEATKSQQQSETTVKSPLLTKPAPTFAKTMPTIPTFVPSTTTAQTSTPTIVAPEFVSISTSKPPIKLTELPKSNGGISTMSWTKSTAKATTNDKCGTEANTADINHRQTSNFSSSDNNNNNSKTENGYRNTIFDSKVSSSKPTSNGEKRDEQPAASAPKKERNTEAKRPQVDQKSSHREANDDKDERESTISSNGSSTVTCLYRILGLQRSADENEIKKAYRRQALKWHPDKNMGDNRQKAERQFKQIAQAYEILSDAKRRREYDLYGVSSFGGNDGVKRRASTAGYYSPAAAFFGASAFGGHSHFFRSPFDVFRDFFGDPFKNFDGNSPMFGPSFGGHPFEHHHRHEHTGSSRHTHHYDSFDENQRRRRRRYTSNIFNHSSGFETPFAKNENDCEFSSVIRFSSSCEPGKLAKKTTTSTRFVDGKKVTTKTTEDNGKRVVEVIEDGILTQRYVNGTPQILVH